MNCTALQNQLLGSEHPAEADGAVRAHLARCRSCRTWYRRLLQIEEQLPQLPVPPSTAGSRLVRQILDTPSGSELPAPLLRPQLRLVLPPAARARQRGQQKVALAFALAAAMLFFAVCWWAWSRQADTNEPAADPGSLHTLVSVDDRARQQRENLDDRLKRLTTPAARIDLLTREIASLHGESRRQTANADQLAVVARYHGQVVRDYLLPQARALPAPERARLLKTVTRDLTAIESEAERRAAELEATLPRSCASLREIAATARAGSRDLHSLMLRG
jgi:hypothetical protein